MRTFFALVLGLTFFASGLAVLTSSAHQYLSGRDAYHFGQKHAKRSFGSSHRTGGAYRHFSNRVGPFRYRIPTRSRLNREAFDFSHPSSRHDVWYSLPYQNAQTDQKRAQEAFRAQRPHLYPRNENNYMMGRSVVRNQDRIDLRNKSAQDNATDRSFQLGRRTQTFRNTATEIVDGKYAFQIPAGFTQEQDGTYRSKNSSLAFRIVEVPEGYRCVQTSFELCGIDLGKNFKDSQNLTPSAQIERVARWNQTVHKDFDSFPTMVEGFFATGIQSNNAYFLFSALNPSNGSVVRIESVSKENEVIMSSQIMHKIFESFRFVQ